MSKRKLFWAGFSDGELLIVNAIDNYRKPARGPELFTTQKAALARYSDIRRVEVIEVEAKRKEPQP